MKEQPKMENPEKLATYRAHKKGDEEKQNTTQYICVGHHYMQTNTNHTNKTLLLLQTTEGKDEQNIVLMRKS
jgi:hypothetical protein